MTYSLRVLARSRRMCMDFILNLTSMVSRGERSRDEKGPGRVGESKMEDRAGGLPPGELPAGVQ